MLKTYIAYLIVFSMIAFFAYALDKRKAIVGAWRIPESLLLGFSFFGGGIGGYLAMHIFRHKTKKIKFHIVNILAMTWQLALLVILIKNPQLLG